MMNYKPEKMEITSVGLLDRPISRISYTVSPSYLLEAELDREWEEKARIHNERFSGTGLAFFSMEEGRV